MERRIREPRSVEWLAALCLPRNLCAAPVNRRIDFT